MRNLYFSKLRLRILRPLTVVGFAALVLVSPVRGQANDADPVPARKITLSVSGVSLQQALQQIETQSHYTFFYNNELVARAGNVSITAANVEIKELLDKLLAGKKLSYEFRGDKILIKQAKTVTQPTSSKTSLPGSSKAEVENTEVEKSKQAQASAEGEKAIIVRGVVNDPMGKPMAGVGVMVKGTLIGTITGNDGSFAIKAAPTNQLTFSFVGYKSQEIFVGAKSNISVTLSDEAQAIDEVVVTALGLKRAEKSLGYATTKVDGDTFASSVTSSNWLSGLTGQVAGLSLAKTGAGAGGSMRVTLRGESSLDLTNNGALFVIDGVPMYNTSAASGESSAYAIDYGDGTGDVNPEDIENITVLKGPAATALYGSEAANGAIIITTKSGDNQEGAISVSFNSNFVADMINTSPDLQYVYGQGGSTGHDNFHYGTPVDGEGSTTADISSWGPKMDGTPYYQYYDVRRGIGVDENGVRVKTPFQSYGNWFKDFFRTGWTATNTLSLSAKINKNNAIRISISDTRNESIVPNSPSSKQNIGIKANNKINKWLTINSTLNYYRRDNANLPQMGYGSSSIMYSLWCMSANMDMNWADSYWLEGKEHIQQDANLTSGKNNPYFVAYECLNTLDRDRIYGNTALNIHLYKGLDLMIRGGLDFSRDLRTNRHPQSSYSQKFGMYSETNISAMQLNADFLLKYNRNLGAGFNLTANFGGSLLNRDYAQTELKAEQLKQPGVYSLANSVERLKATPYGYERQTNSLYGLLQLSWRDAVYLDITGRNDWSSTLPIYNNSYFYPSVSTSVLLNELIDFGSAARVFDLIKLRGSFAQVGHDTNPYRTNNYLVNSEFPGSVQTPTTMNNKDLKPEIVSSWEVGLDLRMFRNRIGVDLSYYDNTSKNLIVNMPVSTSSGVQKRFANAGTIRNYGWEVQVNGTMVKTKNIQWKAYVNWSMNRNEVVELGKGVDSWVVASYSSHAYMTAYQGGTLTDMYGLGYKRAPEGSYVVEQDGRLTDVSGQIIVDENGYPQYSDNLQRIGNCAPDWKGGFGTEIKWKGLSASIAFDGQFGGHVYSYTNSLLGMRGKGTNSLPGRYDGLVLNGVNLQPDGNYVRNNTKTSDIVEYYGLAYAFQNCEQNFVSTQFLKLREVRIEYNFPRQLLAKSRFIKGLAVAVYGRDLFCWSQFPGWDPEGSFMRGAAITPGFEIAQMPGTCSFGGNIKITF